MKKILLVASFLLAGIVYANAQTPANDKDKKDTPAAAPQPGDANAPTPTVAPVVPVQTVDVQVNKDAAEKGTDKACSKQKEACKKGDKQCCKNKTAEASAPAAGSGKACCKKDKANCHDKKTEASAEGTKPETAPVAPAATPAPAPANK